MSKLGCKAVASLPPYFLPLLPPSLPSVSPPQEQAHKKAMQELQKMADATAKELKEAKGQLQKFTEVSDTTASSSTVILN